MTYIIYSLDAKALMCKGDGSLTTFGLFDNFIIALL